MRAVKTASKRAIALACAPRTLAWGIDVVTHWPGNLERLIRWSFDNDEPTIGMSQALRLLGRSSSLSFPVHPAVPNQFVFNIATVDSGVLPGMLLLVLAAALALSVRRRMIVEASLCACLAIAWGSGLVAAARVTQPLAFWLVEWLQPLAWLTWSAVAIVAWRTLRPAALDRIGHGQLQRAGSVVAVTVLVAGTVGYAQKSGSADEHDTTRAPIAAFVAAAEHLDRSQPIHIDFSGDPFSAGTIFLAVANELDNRGFDLCVDAVYANQFGEARVCSGRSDLALLIRDEPTTLAPPDNAIHWHSPTHFPLRNGTKPTSSRPGSRRSSCSTTWPTMCPFSTRSSSS